MLRSLAGLKTRVLGGSPSETGAPPTVFSAFYAGDHARAIRIWEATDPALRSLEDDHHAFAASAILGSADPGLALSLPPPLTLEGFEELLRDQIKSELGIPGQGLLVQPQHLHKSLLAAALGLQAGKKYFVETGTYIGQSLYKVSGLFERLWSVEASEELHTAALALFTAKGVEAVELSHGSSVEMLRQLPPNVAQDAVFFLDAHYSHGITSEEYGRCPVLDEIAIILESSPTALVVVDDLRTMSGLHGYPTLIEILDHLPRTLCVQIAFDQLIINANSCQAWLSDLLASLGREP